MPSELIKLTHDNDEISIVSKAKRKWKFNYLQNLKTILPDSYLYFSLIRINVHPTNIYYQPNKIMSNCQVFEIL